MLNYMTYIIVALILVCVIAVFLKKYFRKKTSTAIIGKTSPMGGLKEKFMSVFTRDLPDGAFWQQLETTLIEADVGVDMTTRLVDSARAERTVEAVKQSLSRQMKEMFNPLESIVRNINAPLPYVILVVGVNGVGKTTTIAKLARNYQSEGKKVLLVAGDTFRAAAVEQLKKWGERLNLEVISGNADADAAAVAFDGVSRAKAKGFDVVIIDTAGRLHTKQNLMEELKKVVRVISRSLSDAPHEKLIIIDATVGSNSLSQVRQFHAALSLTGVVVAKMDGTAKGGIVFAIANELKLPVTHIGVGEKMTDLQKFDPEKFVDAIIG